MKWVIVQTKANSENKAYFNLLRQGFEVFFPREIKNKYFYKTLKEVVKPFFPGYLFVNIENTKNFLSINNTYGVKNIITFGAELAIMNETLFLTLKKKFDDKGFLVKDCSFKFGDKVKVLKKEFFKYEAIFLEKRGKNRAILLLNLINKKLKTIVDSKNLESVI